MWTKISHENVPSEKKLVWIKRVNGSIYLGHRLNKPFSTDKDVSRQCYWYATPFVDTDINRDGLRFYTHFSDLTVDSWMEVVEPS